MADSERPTSLTRAELISLMHDLDELYARHSITDDDKLVIYAILSAFCRYQLENKIGDFYDQVKDLIK
jgi:hypothetical protein